MDKNNVLVAVNEVHGCFGRVTVGGEEKINQWLNFEF